MRAVTRFLLKQLAIGIGLALALLFGNLALQAAEMAEQDSPQDCQMLYLQYPPYQRCTDQWGGCTDDSSMCVGEGALSSCVFGWEKSWWVIGERYCVNAERQAYNSSDFYRLKWPYSLLLSLILIVWWAAHAKGQYHLLTEKMMTASSTPTPR
jgi:hypothetical protein